MAARTDTGEYLSLVIHELRNPLVGIDAAARVMARDLGTHPVARRAERVAEEARHMLELLESVTDAEAAASGRLRSVLRAVDLSKVVRDAVEGAQLGDHRVSVSLPDGTVPVNADARRIGQVLANLLANAAQYTGGGSVIEVTLETDPARKSAVVSVRDHGPGIPTAQRRKLFRKFSRLTTADGTRGSGLGLYISRAIAEDHGGELRYAAARPGSVFSLVLPLRARARKKA